MMRKDDISFVNEALPEYAGFVFADTRRKITGKEIPADFVERRPGDPAELVATSAYAREKLGWKPEYSDVHTLLDSTWKAYLANGKLKK